MTQAEKNRPLVVDLDGTLVKADLMQEAAAAWIAQNPLNFFRLCAWLLRGRAFVKAQIARCAPPPDPERLPYCEDFLRHLRDCGRPLVLATAAHRRHAEIVAAHLGIFETVFATEDGENLAGENKARRLVETFGEGGFDYAGNSAHDIPVWRKAAQAITVNAPPRVRAKFPDARHFNPRAGGVAVWARALRLRHWSKNLLLFVAAVGAHRLLSPSTMAASTLAFLIFGLLASAAYLVNDVLDLAHDRRHPQKRTRPLAAGEIEIFPAFCAALALLAAAASLSLFLPPLFALAAAAYFVATAAYSLKLKRLLLVDVLTLSLLFTVRILAGGAATEIDLSFWLLCFAVFIFLSLALLKRYAELLRMRGAAGRAYRHEDAPIVATLGCAAGMIGVFVLALFIDSEVVRARYAHPQVLWLAVPAMMFWISRIWVLGARGDVGDDPLLFAFRDRVSLAIGALLLVAAYFAA